MKGGHLKLPDCRRKVKYVRDKETMFNPHRGIFVKRFLKTLGRI